MKSCNQRIMIVIYFKPVALVGKWGEELPWKIDNSDYCALRINSLVINKHLMTGPKRNSEFCF